MGLEAVATVETLAAELTVDQAAWRGYVNVQKYHPYGTTIRTFLQLLHKLTVLDPYLIRSGSDILARSDLDLELLYRIRI